MSTATAIEHKTREDWLATRKTGIGASDAATVIGENPYKSPFALWSEKVGLTEPPDLSDKEKVQWGNRLEPVIAEQYEEVTGRLLSPAHPFKLFRSATHAHMLATPDRWQLPLERDPYEGDGVLEIKTGGVRQAPEWEDGGAPLMYQVQLQHQMAVCDVRWGTLAVLIGGQEFKYVDFDRDDKFIAALIKAEAEFWELVKTETPPPVDGSEATRQALKALYPKDSGATIRLPAESDEWFDKLAGLAEVAHEAIEEKRAFENAVINAMGEATFGETPAGRRFSYKTSERKGYTVQPTTVRTLRRLKK